MPQVGQDFGGYRIDGELGRGGMGVVYRAWYHHLDRPVALKVLGPGFADEPGARERFAREAAALARLDSPHVIQILDHGEVDGCLYLAMQLVTGSDLAGLVRDGPLPPRRALDIVAQVAAALGDAHAVGVVHRDVKPANVLLRARAEQDDSDFAYLCDFGIARWAPDPATGTDGVIGTVGYLAPERLDGAPATASSDVYSLGCLLWTLVTGVQPYRGSPAEVIRAHLESPVPRLLDDGPRTAALNGLLADMMAKRPSERPGSRSIRDRIRVLSDGRIPPHRSAAAGSGGPDDPGAGPDPERADVTAAGPDRPGPGTPVSRAGGRRPGSRRAVLVGGVAAIAVIAAAAVGLSLPGGPSAADRIALATPTGVVGCRPVDPGPDDVEARSVCPAGPGVGELRISALGSASEAEDFLSVAAGRDVGLLRDGRCPADLPARERWERGTHSGTLVCGTAGSGTRYVWADASTATVSVLDGAPGGSYPADLAAVQAFVTDMRFGAG